MLFLIIFINLIFLNVYLNRDLDDITNNFLNRDLHYLELWYLNDSFFDNLNLYWNLYCFDNRHLNNSVKESRYLIEICLGVLLNWLNLSLNLHLNLDMISIKLHLKRCIIEYMSHLELFTWTCLNLAFDILIGINIKLFDVFHCLDFFLLILRI